MAALGPLRCSKTVAFSMISTIALALTYSANPSPAEKLTFASDSASNIDQNGASSLQSHGYVGQV
jgi:hypothetical protein